MPTSLNQLSPTANTLWILLGFCVLLVVIGTVMVISNHFDDKARNDDTPTQVPNRTTTER